MTLITKLMDKITEKNERSSRKLYIPLNLITI